MVSVRNIYLDHQFITVAANWPLIREIFKAGGSRLVISEYNLIEISAHVDKAEQIRKAEFIDSLSPRWLLERLDIQKRELRNFLWAKYFDVEPEPFSAIANGLTTVLSYQLGANVPLGMTARKWVDLFTNVEELEPVKQQTVDALRTLQAADPKRKKSIEEQVFKEWVVVKMPDKDPQGKLMTKDKKGEMAKFCYENRNEFFIGCPAMAIEDKLGEIRTKDKRRKPETQDAIDLQHSVVALAYCDSFVTRDGYVHQCATQARKGLPRLKMAEIYRSLDDLAAATTTG